MLVKDGQSKIDRAVHLPLAGVHGITFSHTCKRTHTLQFAGDHGIHTGPSSRTLPLRRRDSFQTELRRAIPFHIPAVFAFVFLQWVAFFSHLAGHSYSWRGRT